MTAWRNFSHETSLTLRGRAFFVGVRLLMLPQSVSCLVEGVLDEAVVRGLFFNSTEHQGARPLADGVRDDDTAIVTMRRRVSISVLKSLQPFSVAAPEDLSPRLNVDVLNVTRTIGKAGNGIEQR